MTYSDYNHNPGPVTDMEKFLLGASIVAVTVFGIHNVVTSRELEKNMEKEAKKNEITDLSYKTTTAYAKIEEPKDQLNAYELKQLFRHAATDIPVSKKWEEMPINLAAGYIASSLTKEQLANAYYATKLYLE